MVTRQCWPILVAVLFSATFVAQTKNARATCGDWLAHSHDPAAVDTGEQVDESHVAATETAPAPRKSPCQNGTCRQAPEQPAVPPAPFQLGPRNGNPALVSWSLAQVASNSLRDYLALDSRALPLDGFPALIDRPPRGV